jgi:hypothetical protein
MNMRDSYFENCVDRAIFVDYYCEEIIENCDFVNCRGGIGIGGAIAIGAYPGPLTIRGCRFQGNVGDQGGAISLSNSEWPCLLENCVFLDNHAFSPYGGGAIFGGGFTGGDWTTIRGCTFYGNNASVGAAMTVYVGRVHLQNNIIAACTGAPAISQESYTLVDSACNVFWQNDHGNGSGSYVLGPTDRTVDPKFCHPVAHDFTLHEGSPCLPENSLGCGLIGPYGMACGPVSVESQSWSEIKGAYRGGVRP